MEHTFFLIEAGGNVVERYINIYKITRKGAIALCAFFIVNFIQDSKKTAHPGASLKAVFCKGVHNAT